MYEIAPKIDREADRLEVLTGLRLLDSLPDPEFDNLTELAATFFSVKFALISLVDEHRQWFKSKFGLDACETPRAPSFCGHAIAGREPFIVLDAAKDARFAENPLVTGAPFVRFYAGIPLVFDDAAIGTLCVIDTTPRAEFDEMQIAHLRQFAQLAEELIEARSLRVGKLANRREALCAD